MSERLSFLAAVGLYRDFLLVVAGLVIGNVLIYLVLCAWIRLDTWLQEG